MSQKTNEIGLRGYNEVQGRPQTSDVEGLTGHLSRKSSIEYSPRNTGLDEFENDLA